MIDTTTETEGRSGSRTTGELVRIPLAELMPHPANANEMSEERLGKLRANIQREGDYPPIIVRPHPELPGRFEILDGHQRWTVLMQLGHTQVLCYVWPCDDEQALLLLATLNRLEGEDVPARRAELLTQLTQLLPVEELEQLLPEDAGLIRSLLDLLDLDVSELAAELDMAADGAEGQGPVMMTFAVPREGEATVVEAIEQATGQLTGPNRRGRALVCIAEVYISATKATPAGVGGGVVSHE